MDVSQILRKKYPLGKTNYKAVSALLLISEFFKRLIHVKVKQT